MESTSNNQIIRFLRSEAIPQIASIEIDRFFIATTKQHDLMLPEDISVSSRKLSGLRKVVRNQRNHGNQRYFTADWPEDNLQELAYTKMVYVAEGFADYLLGDYCVHCPAGTFFIIPPGVPHQSVAPHLTKEHQANGYCVLLQIYAYQHGVHFWRSSSRKSQRHNPAENNYFIYSLPAAQALHFAGKEAEENPFAANTVIRGFLMALLSVVAHEIECGNHIYPPRGKSTGAPIVSKDFKGEIQQYMEANCHKALRLEGVAADFFMSRSRLARLLRKEMNTTFTELLINHRIERACLLLRETNRTVIAISRSLGFRSPSNFHALFSAKVGCTPVNFRQKHQS